MHAGVVIKLFTTPVDTAGAHYCQLFRRGSMLIVWKAPTDLYALGSKLMNSCLYSLGVCITEDQRSFHIVVILCNDVIVTGMLSILVVFINWCIQLLVLIVLVMELNVKTAF